MKLTAKYVSLVLAGLVLISCARREAEEVAVVETDRRGEFIALVEQNGCRLDPATSDAVLVPAGFSDQEASQLSGQLVGEGLADYDKTGALILRTENCI